MEENVAATPQFLNEIKGEHHLRHVDVEHDASKPVIEPGTTVGQWDKKELLSGIEHGVPLRHVNSNDRSEPKIDADIHIGANNHKELMEEVKAAAVHLEAMKEVRAVSEAAGGGPQGSEVDGDTPPNAVAAQLRHVDTIDKSKPLLDPNVHVQKWDKAAFLDEVSHPKPLHHVDPAVVHDASKPAIDPSTHIGPSPVKAVVEQIKEGHIPTLHHVEGAP